MKTIEKNMMDENALLQARLKGMTKKRSRQYSGTHGHAKPLKKTKFTPRDKKYRGVNTKMDYDALKEQMFLKREQMSKLRDELEMRECTFKPEVCMKSLEMTQKGKNLPPIETRGCPDRYNRTLIDERKTLRDQELGEQELSTMKLPNNAGKKAKKEFYQEKLNWKKQAEEKRQQRKLENIEKETKSFIGQPKINDYSKNKIVPADKLDHDKFLNRVSKDLGKREEHKRQLDSKYYNYSYKPALYRPGRTGELGA